MSDVKISKNGYELRTEILSMAKDYALNEYLSKREIWLNTARQNEKGAYVTEGQPSFPKLDDIIAVAAKMYTFVERR